MAVTELNTDNFEKTTENGTWVLDFWASWCGPCKQMKPVFETVSDQVEGIEFGSVDIEDQQELAAQFGVRSIPTFIVLKEGEVQGQTMGAVPESQFKEWVEDQI